METDTKIFKPRYSLRARLMILGLPTLFFLLMCGVSVSFVRFPAAFWLISLALGLCTSLVPFFIIREIRFQNEMIVRRHFLPDYFFTYKELNQIDRDAIKAGGRRIRLGEIVNLDELKDMSQRWKSARILKEAQNHTPGKESLYIQRGYGAYASFWGFMFGIILTFIQPSWLKLDSHWMLGGTFLLVYLIYIYVIPRYL